MGERTSLEICAGAGGQALGLERAGFVHASVVEIDHDACETLRINRGSDWKIVEGDVHDLDGRGFAGLDLLAGGVPCPPFSIAGKRLGAGDDRDLFPQALRLVSEIAPRAVLLENVRGLATQRFASYRAQVVERLQGLGYETWWDLVHASEHGVPQLRPRFALVALKHPWASYFRWPKASPEPPPAVGDVLYDLMRSRNWPGADSWRQKARQIAPTIVGGSKKHGGPDLGPTRAREAWKLLGVDGLGIADEPPGPDFPVSQRPKLTTRMVARLQGFPDDWEFSGRKTASYRQVGNAFPPPIAMALGEAIKDALTRSHLWKAMRTKATTQASAPLDAGARVESNRGSPTDSPSSASAITRGTSGSSSTAPRSARARPGSLRDGAHHGNGPLLPEGLRHRLSASQPGSVGFARIQCTGGSGMG